MMIDVGLGREDYSSIPTTAIGRWLKPLDIRTDLQTILGGPMVIDVGLDREDHSSIPHNCDQE
ncbi:hypothetical protein A2U01_0113623, partial [Trifolium medium]|nr:hypothetical protein [Trifolium medium]